MSIVRVAGVRRHLGFRLMAEENEMCSAQMANSKWQMANGKKINLERFQKLETRGCGSI